jgi:hypothetical protein
MAKQGFYFENMFRSYPFIDDGSEPPIPKDSVVDFNCAVNYGSGFVDGINTVSLYSIEKTIDKLILSFKCDAVGLINRTLVFSVDYPASELTYAFSYLKLDEDPDVNSSSSSSGSSSSSSSSEVLNEAVLWDGFIIFGKLDAILDSMYVGEIVLVDSSYFIEPTLIKNLQSADVQSISIANQTPEQATPASGCGDDTLVLYENLIYHEGLVGDVRFVNGYSCNIALSKADNSVLFTATITDAVKGQFCNDEGPSIKYPSTLVPGIRMGADQEIPDGSELYSGGPTCKDTIKSINGMGGKRLWVVGGKGITLTATQADFLISIEATLNGLAICANPDVYISSEGISP